MTTLVLCCTVFLTVALADYAWARYVGHVGTRNGPAAANWSSVLFLLGSFSTIAYVHNHWLLIPAVLGAYAGTYTGVMYGK